MGGVLIHAVACSSKHSSHITAWYSMLFTALALMMAGLVAAGGQAKISASTSVILLI